MPPARGAAAALVAARRKRTEGGKSSIRAVEQDPVLLKRQRLQDEHEQLLALVARVRDHESEDAASVAADRGAATRGVPWVTHAITVKQPFASAIIAGKKSVENRKWGLPAMPADGSGVWIAVHAAPVGIPDWEYRKLLGALRHSWPQMPSLDQLPLLAILGLIHIKVRRARPVERRGSSPRSRSRRGSSRPARVPRQAVVPVCEVASDPQALGPLCWLIDEVLPLQTPVESVERVHGARKLWSLPSGLLRNCYVRGNLLVRAQSEDAWPATYRAGEVGGVGPSAVAVRGQVK